MTAKHTALKIAKLYRGSDDATGTVAESFPRLRKQTIMRVTRNPTQEVMKATNTWWLPFPMQLLIQKQW